MTARAGCRLWHSTRNMSRHRPALVTRPDTPRRQVMSASSRSGNDSGRRMRTSLARDRAHRRLSTPTSSPGCAASHRRAALPSVYPAARLQHPRSHCLVTASLTADRCGSILPHGCAWYLCRESFCRGQRSIVVTASHTCHEPAQAMTFRELFANSAMRPYLVRRARGLQQGPPSQARSLPSPMPLPRPCSLPHCMLL